MADPALDRDPVEFLAEQFMERLRQGEYPSVEEYAAAHPDKAEQIRALFPTIAAMEKLKSDKESLSGGQASLGPTKLERLGDLRIIREIGRGGMGIVYEAEQESLGRRVAVKVLPKQSLLDDKHLRRFRREAKTAARLHHTNIVPILGVGEQDGYHYYVMQIIRGVGLDEIMPQLVAVSTGAAADGSGVVSIDRHRAENVSSVARAMMEGDLRHLTRHDESSDLASSVSRVAAPSTDSPGAAITEIHSANNTSESSTSFVLNEDLLTPENSEAAPSNTPGRTTGRFSAAYWQSVARIGVQVANALHYAHRQGTLHRDIKPANLLIDGRGNMWVADFGLAKAVEQEDVSRTGDVVGTLRYMAPEQLYGEADARSDIFSLGLTLYELLTLQPAYNELERKRSFIHESGPPEPIRPRRVNAAIPRDIETIVLKAMAPEPKDRYETAAAVAEDLQRFLEDRPILARRASVPERLMRWARRNPAIASLSAIAASLLLAVAIVSTTAYVQTDLARKRADSERAAAQKTSRVALGALDKIFERLAPHRYVSPEDFALTTSEEEEAIPVDTQPVLSEEAAALLTEMMKSYDELAQISGQNSELLNSVALANRRLGDIRARLGQTDQALRDYEKAIAAYESLDEEALEDPKTIAAIASVHNEIGQVLRHIRSFEDWMSNQKKAEQSFEKARELLEPVAVAGSPPELRFELARTYHLTASRFGGRGAGRGKGDGRKGGPRGPGGLKRGGGPSSGERPSSGEGPKKGTELKVDERRIENLDRAVALLEELTRQHDVPDYKELLALCYVDQQRHRRLDVSEGPQDLAARAIELLEELVNRYPLNPDYSFTLCRVYMMTSGMGEPERRLQSIETALSILKRLHDEHSSVPEYLLTQTWVHREAGKLKLRLGDYQTGVQHFDEARLIGETLEAQSSAPDSGSNAFRQARNAAFGFALAHTLAEHEHDAPAVPQELLIRARDELVNVEQAMVESSPRISGIRKRLYQQQAVIYAALGDDDARTAAQAKADALPDDPWPPRREGRGKAAGEDREQS